MKKIINNIEQFGWTGIILYGLILTSIVIFIELHSKKHDKLFIGNQWVRNNYEPFAGRILIAIVIFIGGLSSFFIIKFFIK